jgi:hypothetical protein
MHLKTKISALSSILLSSGLLISSAQANENNAFITNECESTPNAECVKGLAPLQTDRYFTIKKGAFNYKMQVTYFDNDGHPKTAVSNSVQNPREFSVPAGARKIAVQLWSDLNGYSKPTINHYVDDISSTNGYSNICFTLEKTAMKASADWRGNSCNSGIIKRTSSQDGYGNITNEQNTIGNYVDPLYGINIAPPYEYGTTYYTGDLVTNIGNTYKCISGKIAEIQEGYCNQNPTQMAPGTGTSWQMAWEKITE